LVDDEPFNIMGLEMILNLSFNVIGIKDKILETVDKASNG
jgi:hypothetical protein